MTHIALLARYTDAEGRPREIVSLPGHAGSVLVIDRDARTLGDRKLLAHLAADEPAENAEIVCRDYMRDPGRRRCRPVAAEDLRTAPFPGRSAGQAPEPEPGCVPAPSPETAELHDSRGATHRLEVFDAPDMAIPELRWRRRGGPEEDARPEGVRDVVACLESYEPVRSITAAAIERHGDDPELSVAALRAELRRIDASRIVLNRGLRRAVLNAIRCQGMSLSEIAFRCGRVKRDGKGKSSGETSWLSRRVGISPEGGAGGDPTPWIHSDVLALIARRGLGVSPREVEI
jgi:hypothetical protein